MSVYQMRSLEFPLIFLLNVTTGQEPSSCLQSVSRSMSKYANHHVIHSYLKGSKNRRLPNKSILSNYSGGKYGRIELQQANVTIATCISLTTMLTFT